MKNKENVNLSITNKLDPSLISSFRQKVCEHDMVLHIFRNIEDEDKKGTITQKNKWSVVVSAMDWIEVTIDGIDVSRLEVANTNSASIKMITFISCIDILWEAVTQLHRVLIDKHSVPFKDDHSIFNQPAADNDYWKAIRAVFAAHPVNLDDITGENNKSDERWFASWPGGGFGDKDFSAIVYSNVPEKEDIFFDISFADLIAFARKRYEYINVLSAKVDEIIEYYRQDWISKAIPETTDVLDEIKILKTENKQRLDYVWIDSRLYEINRSFSSEITSEKNRAIVDRHRVALVEEIKAIREILQSMNFDADWKREQGDLPSKKHYAFQNIYEPKFDNSWAVKEAQEYFGDKVDLLSCGSNEELKVVVDAALWDENR